MRIGLKSIRNIDRNLILIIVALIAGIGVSVWLFQDVSKREKEVDKLATEVDNNKHQVESLPPVSGEPLTPAQLSEKMGPLFLQSGGLELLREELSRLAAEHHLSNVNITPDSQPIAASSTEAEDAVLLSLSITRKMDVTISFVAEYQDAAQFLVSLKDLRQKVLVRAADLNRGDIINTHGRITGSIALRLYQKES